MLGCIEYLKHYYHNLTEEFENEINDDQYDILLQAKDYYKFAITVLIALGLACLVFFTVLRSDANRPQFARASALSVRTEREQTAKLFTLILLGGLIVTLGAVWMHAT